MVTMSQGPRHRDEQRVRLDEIRSEVQLLGQLSDDGLARVFVGLDVASTRQS
jgi:hypothetical protein